VVANSWPPQRRQCRNYKASHLNKNQKKQKASHLHFAEAFKASLISERMRGRSFDQAYDDQVKNDYQYPNPKYSRKGKEQK
jgi:hypothetical protein